MFITKDPWPQRALDAAIAELKELVKRGLLDWESYVNQVLILFEAREDQKIYQI